MGIWLQLMYNANQLDEQEVEAMEATAIKDAFSAANLFMQDEDQRLAYVNREMAIMDYQSDMNACREEGRREGWQKGRQEGASKAALDIAQNMLSLGMSPDIIHKATGIEKTAILKMQS